MIDNLIILAIAASCFGAVTEATMYPSGFMVFRGTDKDGKKFAVSFRYEEETVSNEDASGSS